MRIRFDEHDLARMHELAVKNQGDQLEPDDQSALENYRRIGLLLDLIHSEARRSLKGSLAVGLTNDGAATGQTC